jgi:Domain of unknown function (DUF4032)
LGFDLEAARFVWPFHAAFLGLSPGAMRRSVVSLFVQPMAEDPKEPTPGDLLKNSSLYREFQAEREEILKHKWYESEKAGHDIGFERALTDWIVKHRSKWRKARQTHSAAH